MPTPARAEEPTPQAEVQEKDSPLLDLSDAAVKRLIKTAKAKGFVTLDQLNSVLPSQEVSPDQIEDTMSMLSDMGINVIDTDEAEEAPQAGEEGAETPRAVVAPQRAQETRQWRQHSAPEPAQTSRQRAQHDSLQASQRIRQP